MFSNNCWVAQGPFKREIRRNNRGETPREDGLCLCGRADFDGSKHACRDDSRDVP